MPYPRQRYVRATFSVHQPILQPVSFAVHGGVLLIGVVSVLTWLDHWSAWAQGALIIGSILLCLCSVLRTRHHSIAHHIVDEAFHHEVYLDSYWEKLVHRISDLTYTTDNEVHVSSYWSDFQDRREATIHKISLTDYEVTLYNAGAECTNFDAPFDSEDILIGA